jgi:ATP-binding cassette subfamily B protein
MLRRYRRLWPYVRRYRGRYALGAALVVAAVALRLTVPTLLGDAFDSVRDLADRDDPQARRQLALTALGILGAALAGAATRTGSRLTILGNSRRVVHDVRREVFDHLLRLSPSFYVRHQTGHVMSRCVNDMRNVQGLTGPVVMYLVETAVLYVVGLTFMFATDPVLSAVGLLPFPFFLVAARRLAGRIQRDSRAAQEQLGEVGASLDESLGGQRVIRSLGLEIEDRRRFEEQARRYRRTMLDLARSRAALQPSMIFLAALSVLLVLAIGATRVAAGDASIGDLVKMIFYLGILSGPTGTLGFVISSLQRGAVALDRIGELMDMPVTIAEPIDPAPAPPIRKGRIDVRGLTVEYPPLIEQPHLEGSLPDDAGEALHRGRRVLDQVSFEVAPGHTLGIVGATGSGKTTLLRALTRQVEVDPGQVFIDDVDVTSMRLRDLRGSMGVVPQESFLFSRSLAENVAIGRPSATRAEIECAVALAQLEKDLDQLPRGLDTTVGERGVRLSGGQRQRAALARVLLLDPRILLLDDTLSAVDATTADEILRAIRPRLAARTTIIVSHRVATVSDADEILVLDDGRVAERGDHATLLARGGLYASLWRRQEEGDVGDVGNVYPE